METDLYINEMLSIPESELVISASRASGPGGQHVNKTSSKVLLRWNVCTSQVLDEVQRARILRRLSARLVGEGEILIQVESERSQLRNRAIAKERLALLIKEALAPQKRRIKTKPSLAAKKRRIKDKVERGTLKKMRRAPLD